MIIDENCRNENLEVTGMTQQDERYRIHWRSKITGKEGHGIRSYSYGEANVLFKKFNIQARREDWRRTYWIEYIEPQETETEVAE